MNWKHCQLNAARGDGNSHGKETKDLPQKQSIVAKRIGVASPRPLLLALHGNRLKGLRSLPCYPPQFCRSYPGKHTFTSGFWLRSSHGSSNPNHSKERSSRVKSLKARGRGAQERLRYGTDKAVGPFHCTALSPCRTTKVFPQPWQHHECNFFSFANTAVCMKAGDSSNPTKMLKNWSCSTHRAAKMQKCFRSWNSRVQRKLPKSKHTYFYLE